MVSIRGRHPGRENQGRRRARNGCSGAALWEKRESSAGRGTKQVDLGEVGADIFSLFGVARSESRVSGPGMKAGKKSVKRPYNSTGCESKSIVSAANLREMCCGVGNSGEGTLGHVLPTGVRQSILLEPTIQWLSARAYVIFDLAHKQHKSCSQKGWCSRS